jgi:mannitol/fructose-specific phosphotransferase system IIA component (Ntr-type)
MEAITSTKNGAWCALSRRHLIVLIAFKTAVDSEEHQDIITQFVSMLEEDEWYFYFSKVAPHVIQ